MVNLVDYFSNAKPGVFIFFEEYTGSYSASEMQNGFNSFYQKCINIQKQKES